MDKRNIVKCLGIIFLFSLAIFLRMIEANRPFWNDEIISLKTLPIDLLHNPFFFGVTSNLPLFFYILKIWALVFNTGVIWHLRLLPLLLSLLTLIIWIIFLNKNFGYLAGFIFGLFFAATPLQVYYSTELRPYILVQLLLSAQTISFYYYLTKKERKHFIYLVVLSVLSLLTHYCSYFYIFSQGLVLGFYYLLNILNRKDTIILKYYRYMLLFYVALSFLSLGIYEAIKQNPYFINSVSELNISTDKSFSIFPKDLNRIKEVFNMYYWYGLYYYYVDWPVQYILKKILFIILAATVFFLFKKDIKINIFLRYVFPVLVLTLVITLILENLGRYPFGGRHIMPFSVFYYATVSLTFFEAIKKSKYFTVVLIGLVILFVVFDLEMPCANSLNLINKKVEIYRECFFIF